MTKYDWSKVPYEIKFLATEEVHDKYITWGYHLRPIISKSIWMDIESKVSPRIIGYNLYSGNWKDSLEERPAEIDLPETVVKSLGEVA